MVFVGVSYILELLTLSVSDIKGKKESNLEFTTY